MADERHPRRLFTVEDVFAIRSRGLVLVPGITLRPGERFRPGDPIVLHRPDGSRVEAEIGELECLSGRPGSLEIHVLLRTLSKDDVPIGIEVWSTGS